MWTLINSTTGSVTVGDLIFKRGDRHVVFNLNKDIMEAINNGQIHSNPPIAELSVDLVDTSGGVASDTIAEITEAGNAGSADTKPTADAIATLTAAVNNLKSVVVQA